MKIGNFEFKNYTYVMAIINLTPDSFLADSRKSGDEVLFAVEKAVRDGAAIIDLGVQSTRPNYLEVPPEIEIERLGGYIEKIKANFGIPVSVDTYFSKTAKAALECGADMINDIWGLSKDMQMAKVIADYNAAVCIMHNSADKVKDMFVEIDTFFEKSLATAKSAGIDSEKICLDGGIGFAKTVEDNWRLLNEYGRLFKFGYPLLIGTSRKSMFGGKVEDRLSPTLESTEKAAKMGVMFVRVHDVLENVLTIKKVYGG